MWGTKKNDYAALINAMTIRSEAFLTQSNAMGDKNEAGARDQVLRQLKAERDRLQARIDTMYLDRLDGRISAEFFDEKSKYWREQQKQIDGKINQLAATGLRSAAEAVQMMKSVSDACAGFHEAEDQQKHALAATRSPITSRPSELRPIIHICRTTWGYVASVSTVLLQTRLS